MLTTIDHIVSLLSSTAIGTSAVMLAIIHVPKINVIKIMERSGNFYKAIRLGYILMSILIGCMALYRPEIS